MQYMLLIYEDESVYGPEKDGAGHDRDRRQPHGVRPSLGRRAAGRRRAAEYPHATTVRTSGRQADPS